MRRARRLKYKCNQTPYFPLHDLAGDQSKRFNWKVIKCAELIQHFHAKNKNLTNHDPHGQVG